MLLHRILSNYSEKFLSRWLVLAFDSALVMALFPLALLLRFNFQVYEIDWGRGAVHSTLITFLYLLAFLAYSSYSGVIRQTGLRDAFIIFQASAAACFTGLAISWVAPNLHLPKEWHFLRSVLVIHFLLSLFFMLAFRFILRALYRRFRRAQVKDHAIRVMIFGSGELGEITRQALLRETKKHYVPFTFIDDNRSKQGKRQDGIPVMAMRQALNPNFTRKHHIQQLIIAVRNIQPQRRKTVIEAALRAGLEVKVAPPADKWMQGELTYRQLRRVRIENLLERDPIRLDNQVLFSELAGRRILISGAAGSIGGEIARQVLHYGPREVVLVDQAESNLYDLQMELARRFPDLMARCSFVVADVTQYARMEKIFEEHIPDLVYHAAAYKHVPLMETFPGEAARVNVFGTKVMADLAERFKTSKFVMVSTDKAVNPTNVMGASKRIAEMYVQSLGDHPNCPTQFVTTRFGNVLGSNGSVVPLFTRQIEEGGPITITHPNIVRFFMTIPEACNLVMEAGAMGKGGEIFVFDMGKPVKIYDLAVKMIRLSGLEPGKDIHIEFTGLRPGEKIQEELLADHENTLPTHHPKILCAKVRSVDHASLQFYLAELEKAVESGDPFQIVSCMKEIAPEYVSNNSPFSVLDKRKIVK
jgi:FlaA1/EpsC-like NDP-sugar epimerase